jgi:hypothetical protein
VPKYNFSKHTPLGVFVESIVAGGYSGGYEALGMEVMRELRGP